MPDRDFAAVSRTSRTAGALLLASALLAAAPRPTPLDEARALYDLWEQRQPPPPADSLRAAADGLERRAAGDRDDRARAWLLALRAELAASVGPPGPARALAERALAQPSARTDRALAWRLHRTLAAAATAMGADSVVGAQLAAWAGVVRDGADARGAAELALARATRAVRRGERDAAAADLREALAGFEALGDVDRDLRCRTLLGIVSALRGETDQARTWFADASARARRHGRGPALSNALVNRAALEHTAGRREAAAALYAEAEPVARAGGAPLRVAEVLRGRIVIALDRGRTAEALALCDSIRGYGVRLGVTELRGSAWLWRARALSRAERPADAVAAARAGLAMADSLPAQTRVGLVSSALAGLLATGRPHEALALADRQRARAAGAGPSFAAQLEGFRAQALVALGRLAEAEAAVRAAEAAFEPANVRGHPYRVANHLMRAGLRLRQQRRPEALREFDRAESALFALRAAIGPEGAREHAAASAPELGGFLARAALLAPDAAQAAEAFERYEGLKARSLQEQLLADSAAGASSSRAARLSLADFRTRVLRPGEVFVAAHLDPDTAAVFVVTRDTFVVAALRDPRHDARARLREVARAIGRRPQRTGRADATLHVAADVVRDLLADVRPAIAGARRVLWSPEGALHAVPGALVAETLGDAGRAPEVAEVPSAVVLTALRTRSGEACPPAPRILALTTSARVDSSLAGPAIELSWLRGTYAPVVRLDGGSTKRPASGDWPAHDVLHFAGHTRIDDDRPWRSTLVLGPTRDGLAAEGVSAEDVLAMQLPTRLAVLAACQSVGDRVVGSEGVAGLAAAFLGAGVPTVVATHWRVDDRATAVLMRAFYRELARGATASAALHAAQRAVRAKREWRHPYYWSAFAVLGDPERTMPLHARAPWQRVPWVPLAASAAVFVAGLALRPRPRRRSAPRGS